MEALSKILRRPSSGRLAWFCPGCNTTHEITTEGTNAWGWNGDAERPSFSPGVLVTTGHHSQFRTPGSGCWCDYRARYPLERDVPECYRCHSYVTDGAMQFLSDCSHDLRGQTVPIPAWPTTWD